MKTDKVDSSINENQDSLQYVSGAMFRCVFDEAWTMEYITDPIQEITGYSPVEFIADLKKSYAEIIHPDDRDMVKSLISQATDICKPYNIAYRILDKNGNIRWVNEYGKGYVDEKGRACIDGLIMDITRQILGEEELKSSAALLKEKTEELERYFNMSLDLLCIANTDGEFIKTNPEWQKLLGYSQRELDGRRFIDFIHPDDLESTLETISQLESQKEVLNFVNRYRKRDGSYSWIEWRSKPFGKTIFAAARDITRRKRTEQYLELSVKVLGILNESEDLKSSMKLIFASIKDVIEYDAIGLRLQSGDDYPYFLQDGFEEDFIRTENSLRVGCPNSDICRSENGHPDLDCICGMVISGRAGPENPMFTSNSSFWTNDSNSLLESPNPLVHRPRNRCMYEGYLSLAYIPVHSKNRIIGLLQINSRNKNFFNLDIIYALEGIAMHIGEAYLRHEAEAQIRHMATHDSLTDLPSLRLAEDRLNMAMRIARRTKTKTAVMFVDLDGFKSVNDSLGHDAGDDVLIETAWRLRSTIRETDTVARIGGDEFLIIIPGLQSSRDVEDIARKLIAAVSKPVELKEATARIGASIGIALYPEHANDSDSLIKLADKAMYKVKSSGKNGFGFTSEGK